MSYLDDQLTYLYSLARFGIKPGLAIMDVLMAALGNPQHNLPSVHITGTNGKGSTAALLESALRHGGVRTGLYTSPHIYCFNERVRIEGQAITDAELSRLIEEIRTVADQAEVQPTFFEFTTALALLHFARQQVDLAVIEVGMGGLLDATNVITPKVSVITNIGLDHTHVLGATRLAIARRKAGIIKPGVPVVTAETNPRLKELFDQLAARKGSRHLALDDHLTYQTTGTNRQMQLFTVNGSMVAQFTIPLLGAHQVRNAATALLVIQQLAEQGIVVPLTAIKKGFATTTWEGRLDIVSEHPFILVDGAHNPPSIEALRAFITDSATKLPSYDVLITAQKQDKSHQSLLKHIVPLFKHIITTEGVYQPEPAEQLAEHIRTIHSDVRAIPDIKEAVQAGTASVGPDGTILITGSLYMIPEALAYLRHKETVGKLIP